MAKPKTKQPDLGQLFWIILGALLIWIGISGLTDIYKNNEPNDLSLWFFPLLFIILGGMILGVAVNKLSNSILRKNDKS